MRLRIVVLASLLAAALVAVIPATGGAAPKHNHGLTINATPNPIDSGDPVLIYGQLNTTSPGNRPILLYHRVGPARHFSLVGSTQTNAQGFYEFTRADGVVTTNRSWFVRGPSNTHSRTVNERVRAEVSISASTNSADTNHRVVFTGHVEPNHAGERVYLQAQQGANGDDWRTIDSGRLGPGSNYSISHRFLQPGERDLRVVFKGDQRNIRSASDTVTVTVSQTQNPSFTITTSAQNIDENTPVTISGVLSKSGTATPDPGQTVQLWHRDGGGPYEELASTTTDANGAYRFTDRPIHNQVYQARTVTSPKRHTAQLFEGVRDVVTISPTGPTNAVVGQKITFTGSVSPDKAGHVIYLQRLGADGDWHTVKESRISHGSTYSISWTFGSAGTKVFRTRVPGGEVNASGHSPAVTVVVTLPPVATLPPAS